VGIGTSCEKEKKQNGERDVTNLDLNDDQLAVEGRKSAQVKEVSASKGRAQKKLCAAPS